MSKQIPPKNFYKMPQSEQEKYSVTKMNECYEEAERWRQIAIECRRHRIPEPEEINRPDEAILKDQ